MTQKKNKKEKSIAVKPGDLVRAIRNIKVSWGSIEDASRREYFVAQGETLLLTRVQSGVKYKRFPYEEVEYIVYEMLHQDTIVSSWILEEDKRKEEEMAKLNLPMYRKPLTFSGLFRVCLNEWIKE